MQAFQKYQNRIQSKDMKFAAVRILTAAAILASFMGTCLSPRPVEAQTTGLIYVVQQDDTLYSISQYFHTSTLRIQLKNYLSDADVINPGKHLIIPGFDDLSGTLTPTKIGIGDTALSLMRQSRSDVAIFTRINFLTSPGAIVVGQKLFTLSNEESFNIRVPVTDGGLTGLELAAKNNLNPWTAAEYNATAGPWYLIPNDILYLPSSSGSSSNEILPGVEEISASGLSQGKTAALIAKGSAAASLAGNLTFTVTDIAKEQEDQSATPPVPETTIPHKNMVSALDFFQQADGSAEALQGVPRMAVPGAAALTLTNKDSDGNSYSIEQNLMIKAMDYGFDSPMQVSDNVIDPKVTEPEDAFVFNLVAPVTDTKLWNGAFAPPTSTPTCLTDTYGRLRSFNSSNWIYWHSGFDYCGGEGDKIFAAADGTVVYVGELTVRGNATLIDHGHGLYTGYYHQSKIEVSQGEKVSAGQEIGLIGATGRVTGPHLHFDVFVGGVQVDPSDWLNGTIP